MAVTTTKTFPATTNGTTTTFSPIGIELNNQDDLDVYVTKTTAGIAANNGKRILHYKQSTTSTLDTNHPQVNDTTGLYYPSITNSGGTETLNNYTISTDNNTITFNTALPSGAVVHCERRTRDGSGDYTTFAAGSTIRAADLNTGFDETRFQAQEARNRGFDTERKLHPSVARQLLQTNAAADGYEWTSNVDIPGTLDVTGNTTVDGNLEVTGTFAVTGTSSYTGQQTVPGGALVKDIRVGLDGNNEVSTASGNLVLDSATGTVAIDDALTVAGSLTVTGTTNLAAGSIGTSEIADSAVTEVKIANSAVSSAKIATSAVVTSKIGDAQVTNVKLADDSVTDVKIANSSVGSSELKTNAVITANITDLNVTTAKIADVAVTTGKIADTGVTTAKIADDAVTNAKINASAVGTTEIADSAVTTAKLNNSAVTGAKIASATIAGSKLEEATLTDREIGADSIGSSELKPNAVGTSHITDLNVTTAKIADDAVTAAKIADAAIITNAEATAGITADDVTFFTTSAADYRYFRQDSTETIGSGATWSGVDTKIATTGAIDARIIDLVDDVGGFVPIANETSFPNTNPDINDGAGTIVSIGELASNHTSNGSGVITISNGTVGNSTVTITGAANSTTYSAGYGLLVETTTTLNTYTFHRLTTKATEVTTVASNITNVNTVAGSISNVNAVAGNATNINAVAADATDIGTVAGKATEIGRLGTADAVSDMNTLGTTAIVSDLDTCADISSNITTVAGISSNVTTVAGISSNVTTVAGIQANVTTVAGNNSNVTTVAGSISDVNNFADLYQIASSNPSTDGGGNSLAAGDLYFNTSANELKVYNGSAWQGGVTATGSFAVVTGNTFTGNNTYNDSVKAIFGTGGDLEIYHDGSNSVIKEAGTGDFRIQTASFRLRNEDASEMMISADADGAVYLAHNGTTKLETTSGGVTVAGLASTGNITAGDNVKALWGDGEDLQIYHSGSNSFIDEVGTGNLLIRAAEEVQIKDSDSSEAMGIFKKNGAVELYHNNVKKFETTSGGITVTGNCTASSKFRGNDDVEVSLGDGEDFKIYHNGSNSYIKNVTGGLNLSSADSQPIQLVGGENMAETLASFTDNGSVDLYYDNSKKFETTSAGATVTGDLVTSGNIDLADSTGGSNNRILLGTGDDLEIYHDGSNGYVSNSGSGNLTLVGNGTNKIQIRAKSAENSITCNSDGAVELYYNNVKTATTVSDGFKIVGTEGGEGRLYINADEGDDNADAWRIEADTTGSLNIHNYASGSYERSIACAGNGNVELFYDDAKKFETLSGGVTVTGDCYVTGDIDMTADDKGVKFGNDDDFLIKHTGSHAILDNDTGDTYIKTAGMISLNPNNTEDGLLVKANGACELYHDNAKKLETVADGINVTGNIGIGDTTPSYAIDIKAAQPHIRLEENSSGGSKRLEMLVTSAGQAKIAASQSAQTIIIETSGVERCAITANGITFNGDTAAANALDDYEEGTWTPALGGSGNSFTYHANTGGVYTKIGRMVYASGFIQLTARSGTSQLTLTGLPFAAGDHSSGSSTVEGGVHTTRLDNSQAATSGPMGTISSGASTADLWHAISSGNGSGLDADEIDTTFVWGFTVIYPA